MAQTTVATGSAGAVKRWREQLFRNTTAKLYWKKFFGGENSAIHEVSNDSVSGESTLTKGKGESVTYSLVMDLDEKNYVTSNTTLDGKEQSLTVYNDTITLEEYAFAVLDAGPLDRQRPAWNMDKVSREKVERAGAKMIDYHIFTALQNSPTKIFYGGTSTATSDITTSSKIAPALISKVNTWCSTGGNESQPIIRPIMVDGREYRVMLVHDDVAYDLNQNAVFNQARREAEVRGKENPIFTGAYMIYDGVVVHKHSKVDIVTNWGSGSNLPGAKCIMFGAQAAVLIWGERPKIVVGKKDWERQHGYSFQVTMKVKKPVFNSLDYGSVGVDVYRTQISDA